MNASDYDKLQHAADCALWLLEQPELKPLIDGDWGDPEAIRNMLRKAGCIPSCSRRQAKVEAKSCDNCGRGPKDGRACSERPCFSYSRWLAKPTAKPEQAKVEGQEVRYYKFIQDGTLTFASYPMNPILWQEITAAEYAEAKANAGKVEPCELPRDCDKCWWFDDQCPDGSDNHNGKCKNWKKAYQPPKPAPEVKAIEPLDDSELSWTQYPPEISTNELGCLRDAVRMLCGKLNETIEAVNRLRAGKE